jgi:hypothetical protein
MIVDLVVVGLAVKVIVGAVSTAGAAASRGLICASGSQ